jgi:alpha-mannosidase
MKTHLTSTLTIILLVSISLPLFSLGYEKNKVIAKVSGDSAKKDTIQIIGHAHMDMNWKWTYSESMKMCNDNLRQMVAFMDEYPDFTMIQSQAAVYRFVEMVDPPLFKRVQEYVKKGRLELGGGSWVEGDENLPSGEAISRSFLLGQRYFQSRFGKIAHVGWLPDNFGHISQMPQIFKLSGCDYFYFFRAKPYKGAFWWVSSDSSNVLCYANDNYNGRITPELKSEVDKYSPEKRRILQITGVGDHGGGPTRANIELIHKLDKTPGYPSVKFTTAGDFFKKSEKEMDGRPTHRGEMQFVCEGCYTNVADIKEGNRSSENLLYSSEFFNTLRWLNGDKYPADELRDLWTNMAFNQFHDILPGTAINESNKETIARYFDVLRKSTDLRDNAFRKMADEVKFKTGMGQPVVAYNLQPLKRNAIVEATVYSHAAPFSVRPKGSGDFYTAKNITPIDKGQGNVPTVLVCDGSGKTYPAQVVWSKSTPPGFTSKVQFIVNDFPAGGYKTFYVDMTKPGEYNEPIPFKDHTFETDFFKIKFDMKTGNIISLFDKRSGTEYVKAGGQLNTLRMFLQQKGGIGGWTLDKNPKIVDVSEVKSVKVVEDGPVKACIETVKTWGRSRFVERTTLYRSYPRINYDMEVHWLETSSDSTDVPMLRAIFPLSFQNPKFYCQVPFEVIERSADGKTGNKSTTGDNDGQEVPAQKWVDVSNGEEGVALLNNSKYGHSYHNGDLRLTLMRASSNHDLYPNLGIFNISYALYPHSGDWTNGVWTEGDDFNVPVYAAEPPSLALVKEHASRPEEESFFSVLPSNIVMTGMKQSEDKKDLVIRVLETEGKETIATINLPVKVRSAQRLNLIEFSQKDTATPEISGKSIRVKLKPHEIVTLGIKQ